MQDYTHTLSSEEIDALPLAVLRDYWAKAWGIKPHRRISTPMLRRSLAFKMREQEGKGYTPAQRQKLDELVQAFRRNPRMFDKKNAQIRPGTRLIREWKGIEHSVLVKDNGFEYQERIYTSLSEVASLITGTRWNGWLFFGLKKKGEKKP